ncbi:ABC transporter ATP-binding protein [Bradyrhizobium sp. LHD-71]|uniref:ABC transporter ATP-binding protein n=1 Tax=Bradyrhizobium sp. LHD-71 TaxID=3072141 RepID=UPI00280F956E|nr:ABC transporter ATP-binding protein [Bradyrhizobium sp. LHD-71]MDQ8732330.1 ABC transporter ATP-binding protein [Bradyrhizobium sp. LHD-71]
MATIALRHVTKRYHHTPSVDDISLDIAQGELVAFVGPSGCGKTTTLRMIAGLTDVTSGSILFDGRDVSDLPTYRRNTGIVFQGYALFPHMTVAENVAFGLQMRRVRGTAMAERVNDALAMVRLEDYAHRLPREMSGGQQQRVALARAIAIKPDALLLDEPLSALDAKLRQEVRDEIRRLQRSLGLTTVFVTHDQEEAVSIADRIVVMNAGKIEQVGSPQEVYEKPATRFVAQFIGLSNFLSGEVEAPGRFRIRGGGLLTYGDGKVNGGRQDLIVRPEKIELGAKPDQGLNHLEGVIDSVTYLGPLTEVRVRLASGEKLVAHRQNRRLGELETFQPGQPTTIAWAPEAGFVL